MRSIRAGAAVLALTVAGGAASPARAAFVAEYFNDAGTSGANLNTLGWTNPISNTSYVAGTQVNYSAPGYSSAGNQSDTNDGAATGSNTTNLVYKTIAGMTGTVWVSAAVSQTTNGDVLLWLDKTNTTASGTDRDFVALRGTTLTSPSAPGTPEAVIAYNGATDDGSDNTDLVLSTPHLILLKIDMNFSAALDRITFWVDPDLSGGEAGLGTTVGSANGPKYLKDTADAYGTSFDGYGLSFSATSNVLDALRVSNDADGFVWVTTGVPEPTTAALLGVAGVGLCARRRRR